MNPSEDSHQHKHEHPCEHERKDTYKLHPVKWKYRGAAKDARSNGMRGILSELQSRPRLVGVLLQTSVLVAANEEEFSLLERGCFGKLMHGDLSPSSVFQDTLRESTEDDSENFSSRRIYQLTLVEAFYLCCGVECLHIFVYDNKRRVKLEVNSAWQAFQQRRASFASHYVAYHHLRNKNWVVRPGIQYGADFMAYRQHPSFVHSDFAVLVISEDNNPMKSWVDVHANTRLCTSVAKTLLLAYVSHDGGNSNSDDFQCFREYSVKTIEVRRWLAEKNRD